jgi:hypothetical protein
MRILIALFALIVVYIAAYLFYSVNYLGFRTLPAGPYLDVIFPWAHVFYPIWNGRSAPWPTSHPSIPTAATGLSPEGGMRHAAPAPPVQLRPGYAPIPKPTETVDRSGIPAPQHIAVGSCSH